MTKSWGGRIAGSKNVRWSKRTKEAFLDRLAATCNVSAAASAIGLCLASVYNKRRSDPDFRAQWEEALVGGYQLLETRLVGHALAGGTTDALLPEGPLEPPVSADFAMRLIALRKSSLAGRRNTEGRPRQQATKEETVAAILKKLAIIETRLKATP